MSLVNNREETEVYLIHYGAKGMKWGIRKKYKSVKRAAKKEARRQLGQSDSQKAARAGAKAAIKKAAGSQAVKTMLGTSDKQKQARADLKASVKGKLAKLKKKKDPAEIRKQAKEHNDMYEADVKDVKSKGAKKVAKAKSEKKAHIDSYEKAAKKEDRKAEVEKGVAKIIVDGERKRGNEPSAQRHQALGDKRAAKHTNKAKEIRTEKKAMAKDWDRGIAKIEKKTKKQVKEIRTEQADQAQQWEAAAVKAEKKGG